MSENILLVCDVCGNDDEFKLWSTNGKICAYCEECDTLQVWWDE